MTASMRSGSFSRRSLVYGIEPYVILKDIWGASNREVDRVARWVADAVIEKALREVSTAAVTKTGRPDTSTAAVMKTDRPDTPDGGRSVRPPSRRTGGGRRA